MKTLYISILISIFVLLEPLSFAHGDILEVQNMNVYTNKDSYGKGEVIRISGEIQSANGMTVSKDIPITVVLTNDVLHKTMQTLKTYPSPNGNFAIAGIPTTNSSWESSGTYTVTASYGNIVNTDTSFSFEMGDHNLLTPLKQSELGIPSDKIECRSDLQSITKAEDNSTACVTQQAVQTLVKRGWTTSTLESPISIGGLNAEYTICQPINATVNFTGWMNGGLYPDVKILNADNGSKVWNNCLYAHTEHAGGGGIGTASYNVQCDDKYPIINETGTYAIIASVDGNTAKARFTVTGSKVTSIYDAGITPMSANVANTNFTINYNIFGGKISKISQDSKSNTLIVSLQTTGDGRLTLKIPRVLLDSKSAYSNQDTEFIILVDKQEVKYTETTSIDARTLTIPFGLGAKMIEITAPVNI